MKKLILLLFIFSVIINTNAQSVKFDDTELYRLDTFNITTSDTSWSLDWSSTFSKYKGPWVGSVSINWASLTGTLDGTLKLQATSDSAVHWVDISSYSAVTMNSADSTIIFNITSQSPMQYDRTRIYFDRNNITGGTIIPSVRAFQYRRY